MTPPSKAGRQLRENEDALRCNVEGCKRFYGFGSIETLQRHNNKWHPQADASDPDSRGTTSSAVVPLGDSTSVNQEKSAPSEASPRSTRAGRTSRADKENDVRTGIVQVQGRQDDKKKRVSSAIDIDKAYLAWFHQYLSNYVGACLLTGTVCPGMMDMRWQRSPARYVQYLDKEIYTFYATGDSQDSEGALQS
ncbi:hypothetical protein CPC08DRAFT_765517 [Agrocybe pediades]|nr:hypothetical protein CPC08DRAFT_765517 [Agrocybe pediades]